MSDAVVYRRHLKTLTVLQLKDMIRKMNSNIPYSNVKKAQLIEAIVRHYTNARAPDYWADFYGYS